ncbi:MAG: hypothetical protein IT307_19865 [Chloroflexi bacterium]|nr:hypothetical protein [Chloroflexota bacterium]
MRGTAVATLVVFSASFGFVAHANTAPTISNLAVSPSPIDENNSVTLTAQIQDPDPTDTLKVMINWGDKTIDRFDLVSGTSDISKTHKYLDDPKKTSDDTYHIVVTVSDVPVSSDNSSSGNDNTGGEGHQVSQSVSVVVHNVAPQLTNVHITSPVTAKSIATLTGNIVDPGSLDSFKLFINWGDNHKRKVGVKAGQTSFSVRYKYNKPAPGGGDYTVSVQVVDDDGGQDSETLTIHVNPKP